MQRVIIIGSTGSGKTTLGRQLAELTGLPHIELDDLYWRPEWTEAPEDEFRAAVKAAAEQEHWIIVGNYSKVREYTWPRADTVIWLDYSFPRVFIQLLSRCIRRASDQLPICNGNFETWGKLVSKDSIIAWLFQSFHRNRKQYGDLIASREFPHLDIRHMRRPADTAAFMGKINQPA